MLASLAALRLCPPTRNAASGSGSPQEAPAREQPDPQVEVHGRPPVAVPSADGLVVGPAEEHAAGLADRVGPAAHDAPGHLHTGAHADEPPQCPAAGEDVPALVDHVPARGDERKAGIGGHGRHLVLQAPRVEEVVGADQLDQRRAAQFDRLAPIVRLRKRCRIGHDANARIVERSGDPRCFVRALVVQHHEFEIAVRLLEHTADRLREERLTPVDGDAHGHFRRH